MATSTTNLSLTKPAATDTTKIREDFNDNMDLIDAGVQMVDAGLTSIAALTTAANKMIYTTALDTYAVIPLTAFARTILDDADASTVRGTIGALQDTANAIDSDHYTDASIDHEHLAPDIISGLTEVTSADADYIMLWDATDSALKKCDMAEVRGVAGFTTFSQFDEETPWKVYYSNAAGDITEITLGSSGTYLKSNGAAAAPTFETVTGTGANAALDNLVSVAINTSLTSDSADTDNLGSATKEWLNLYIGDAGKIYLGLGQELSIHRSAANTMTLTASSGVVTSAGLTVGGTLALGANSITMSGSIGVTGTRVIKGWFTDLECTNTIAGSITGTAAVATGFTCTDNENEDLACPIVFVDGATGTQGAETDGDLTYNPLTGTVNATIFTGALTGNVTGNCSGSSGSCTGLAATATALATARTIGGTSFNGTANIMPVNITVADESADAGCFVAYFTAATGDLPPKTGDNLTFNSNTGVLTATGFVGDGSLLTDVGFGTATALTLTVRADENIKKGQAVYISGSTGAAYPNIALCDADNSAKIRMVGIAAADINSTATGLVRMRGLLEGIDTSGATECNPDGETWVAGQLLFVHTDGSGGYTKTRPTSGRIIKMGYSLYGSSGTDAFVCVSHENPVDLSAASGEDLVLRMGDSGASNKVNFKDYANNPVAYVNSDGKANFTSLLLNDAVAKPLEITGAATTAQLYIAGSDILADGEQAIWINCPSEDGATNGMWISLGSTVNTGDLTGARIKTTSQAVDGGDAVGGQQTRAVYGQAIAAASKHAGLLQGGLFVADVSAGNCVAYNVHALCGHYSAGASADIDGDLYVGYLRAQSRSTNPRTVEGHDCLLALENEAVEGAGQIMDSAIRIFDTNMGVDGFTYGIDMSGADITTADIILQNGETISNTTDARVTIGGGDLNIDTGKKYLINGTQITSAALSDVDSIAMLDESESVTGSWTFPEVTLEYLHDTASPYVLFSRARDGETNVVSGDILGSFFFYGYHTGAPLMGAEISAKVDGTPGENDMPTRLEFFTSLDGTADDPTLRMAIDNAGNIKMGDGDWTNYINITAGGVLSCEGTASITGYATSGANTSISSILNAGLYVGRDSDNTISFATDDNIIFKTNGKATGALFYSTGELNMNNNTIGFTQQTVSYGAETTTVDWKLGNKATVTLTGNVGIFAFTNPTNPCNLLLKIVQDGTGSRTVTDWDTDIKFPGGTDPTLSTAVNAVDIISFYWDGTNYHGVISKAFAVPA